MKERLIKLWEFLNTPPENTTIVEEYLEQLTESIEQYTIHLIFRVLLSAMSLLQRVLLSTPSVYIRTEAFWQIYEKMIYLGVSILAIIFLIIAIQILKDKVIDYTQLSYKIIIFTIGISFAPHFLLKVIDIFNRIARLLINIDAMRIPTHTTFGDIFGLIIYMVIMVILSYKLIYFYAKRQVLLVAFAVLNPVILACWCLPKYENIVSNWIDYILSLLIAQVFHALILLILGSIIMGVSEVNNVLSLVFQIGALGVMNEAEEILGKLFGTNAKLSPNSLQMGIQNMKEKGKAYKTIKGVISRWI